MKIAIPVKMNRENPAVAPLFGKAKWFAFIEHGNVEIKANPAQGGQAVIRWFADEGVDTVIMQEMGISPYQMIQAHGGMKLYHSGFERILLSDLIKKFADGELEMLDDAKMQEIIKHHEGRHSHDDHHHEHEHGHHHHH
ncbi:MAG: NifB/NifX family molybdenum-iron cluster-binding protein [Campylobacterales bacterium]|nr:NifB/NifX family molybdenum-iron cluster-binding protein [Campylobacterales bacterium]